MIIHGCNCDPSEFDEAMKQLIDEGWVESREMLNGKHYRAKE